MELTKSRYRCVLCTLLLAAVASGCTSTRAWTKEDSWYAPKPTVSTIVRQVAGENVAPVRLDRISAAERMLESASFVPIPADEAGELSGKAWESKRLFLVRGVALNESTGGFAVLLLADDDIVVMHSSLGGSAVPMRRHPVIVELERVPRHVFTECSMAK
jgi:hypothetical protein